MFAPDEMYLTLGRFVDDAPWTSDYTFERIYYRSIRERDSDYLTTRDYLWRWDTDWFWCSKNVHAQHPLVRRLLGRKRLNSITYQQIMRWNSRWGVTRALDRLARPARRGRDPGRRHPARSRRRVPRVPAPRDRHPAGLAVPDPATRSARGASRSIRCSPEPSTSISGSGTSSTATSRGLPGFLNRRIERKVAELSGIKSLYSDSFYTEDEFWSIYDGARVPGAEGPLRSRGVAARSLRQVRAGRRDGAALNARPRRRNLRAVKIPATSSVIALILARSEAMLRKGPR